MFHSKQWKETKISQRITQDLTKILYYINLLQQTNFKQ